MHAHVKILDGYEAKSKYSGFVNYCFLLLLFNFNCVSGVEKNRV
jgi:hypothetical protein